MAIKALVTGDLHLGKRSAAVPVESEKASTKYTWKRMTQYAVEHRMDLVLLTGDVVDQDNKFYEAIEPLQEGFNLLGAAGIPVYMVAGNHDYEALPRMVSMNTTAQIYLLGQNGTWERRLFTKGAEVVQLIGWSFPDRYVDGDATALFRDSKPEDHVRQDIPALVLVHGDLYQATSRYNPLNTEALKNSTKVQAWLLGHIHKTEVINQANPLILYPGSPHALSAKEQGEHGFYTLTIEGKTIGYRYVSASPVCYRNVTIDVSSAEDESAFRTSVIDALRDATLKLQSGQEYQPDFLVYDLLFTGAFDNLLQLQNWGEAVRNYDFSRNINVSIRSLSYDTRPITDIGRLLHDPSYPGVLAQAIRALEAGTDTDFTKNLTEEWKERFRQVAASTVFLPLHLQPTGEEVERMAHAYILKMCNALIGELNMQKNEN
jgi:DNA repair exonuclease SbcCD nuclease subunit